MNQDIIENIKQSFITYFGFSQKKEIESLFEEIIIILWDFNDNGEINFVYDNKDTEYSNKLKKYLKENNREIIVEGLEGFSLPESNVPVIFANSKSDTIIAVLIHELLHQLLGKKLSKMATLEHDFLVELIIEYATKDILNIYNSDLSQNNKQFSTYLLLDEVLDFPLKSIYQQLINEIKNDATVINKIVGIENRVSLSVYFQDLLDKALTCDRERSFKEQYGDGVNEYSHVVKEIKESILQSAYDYRCGNKPFERT